MRSPSIVLYGSDQPLPEQIPLRAGPLSLIYENGDLRTIKLGDRELLRRVYVAVRDHNWDTIHAVHSDVEMDIGEDHFSISYTARHQQGDIDFVWKARINGTKNGTIEFHMDGEALSTFRRNRIGFCVLHPMVCAGDPAAIEHVDGTLEKSRFPVQIAPQLLIDGTIRPVYPFANMRALAHQAAPDLTAKVTFSGDIFEMEDQRNWTDASYKTYSTPLELPFPVEVAAGTKIVQSVVLMLEGNEEQKIEERVGGDVVVLTVDCEEAKQVPAIGLGMAGHDQPLTEREIERLRALYLSHLRVDLSLVDADYGERLALAVAQASALGVELEIALFVGDDAALELTGLREQLDILEPPVCRWLIFHRDQPVTPAGLVDLARLHLESYAPDARFGTGSNAYFTDINRLRPDTDNADFLTYSLNPQVHAFDNASLVETVEAQTATVESSRRFADGKGIVVSPVTLLPRFNPNATGPEPEPTPGQLPPQVDVRQMSLFGAAWSVGSLKYLLGSGLEAVTYFETTGWRGLMEQADGCPLPEEFHSEPAMVFPLYHVLADVGEFADGPPSPPNLGGALGRSQAEPSNATPRIGGRGADLLPVTTSDSLGVDGLALRRGDDLMLLIANLSPQNQEVQIEGMGSLARIRRLDEQTFDVATGEPDRFRSQTNTISTDDGRFLLELSPYCVARIDTNVKIQALLDECIPLIKAMGKGRKAVSIGGSYGKGTPDKRSDVDFRLFCEKVVGAPNQTETAVWQTFRAAVERWCAEGIDIDYCWIRTVGDIERELDAWLSGQVQPREIVWCLWGYHLLTDLNNQVVLDDPTGLIAEWQARLTPYPRILQQAIIDKHLKSLNFWRADYHYRNKVARGDAVFLAAIASRLVHDMMQVLFAINETYYVGDGNNLRYASSFAIVPHDFAPRVEGILYPVPSEGMFAVQYEALLGLIDEVVGLAKTVEAP